MKRLLLIRHAKAVNEDGFRDFERPLQYSGMEDAAIMATRLKSNALIPQIIISSPALRTKTTANIFSEHLLLPAPLTDKLIYNATEGNLLRIINDLPYQYDFIGLVGHNPGMAQLLYYFPGESKDVPTCAISLIDFEFADWKSISMNTGKLVYYDTPAD